MVTRTSNGNAKALSSNNFWWSFYCPRQEKLVRGGRYFMTTTPSCPKVLISMQLSAKSRGNYPFSSYYLSICLFAYAPTGFGTPHTKSVSIRKNFHHLSEKFHHPSVHTDFHHNYPGFTPTLISRSTRSARKLHNTTQSGDQHVNLTLLHVNGKRLSGRKAAL